MYLTFTCPACDHWFSDRDLGSSQTLHCPACGKVWQPDEVDCRACDNSGVVSGYVNGHWEDYHCGMCHRGQLVELVPISAT